jgi:hypothetical protein
LPYRRETVEAISLGLERGVSLVAITDSHASPLSRIARHAFVVPTDSPLPLFSNTAATAILETRLVVLFGHSSMDVTAAVGSSVRGSALRTTPQGRTGWARTSRASAGGRLLGHVKGRNGEPQRDDDDVGREAS